MVGYDGKLLGGGREAVDWILRFTDLELGGGRTRLMVLGGVSVVEHCGVRSGFEENDK
jgi:hypothetical protein